MIIHFSILGVILFASLIWEKRILEFTIPCVEQGKRYKELLLPWALVFGYVAFLAAMRSNVNDTHAYIVSFQRLETSWQRFFEQISLIGEKDWAFDAVSILFKKFISENYHLWMAFYAIIESIAFCYVLRRNSVSLLDSSYFFFCSTLYYNYFSMMRQWFAVSVIFWASKFIKENKFIYYCIICVIVAQFHSSAYFMIPVYFIVRGKAWSKKQVGLISLFSAAILFLNPILKMMEEGLSGTTYDYAVSAMSSSSGSSGVRILIALVPVALAFIFKEEITDDMINICVNMSLLNLLLNVLATFTSGLYVVRLATYFSVYNMVLYPYLLNVCLKDSWRIVKPIFYIIYFFFYIYQMQHQSAFGYNSDILGIFY